MGAAADFFLWRLANMALAGEMPESWAKIEIGPGNWAAAENEICDQWDYSPARCALGSVAEALAWADTNPDYAVECAENAAHHTARAIARRNSGGKKSGPEYEAAYDAARQSIAEAAAGK